MNFWRSQSKVSCFYKQPFQRRPLLFWEKNLFAIMCMRSKNVVNAIRVMKFKRKKPCFLTYHRLQIQCSRASKQTRLHELQYLPFNCRSWYSNPRNFLRGYVLSVHLLQSTHYILQSLPVLHSFHRARNQEAHSKKLGKIIRNAVEEKYQCKTASAQL